MTFQWSGINCENIRGGPSVAIKVDGVGLDGVAVVKDEERVLDDLHSEDFSDTIKDDGLLEWEALTLPDAACDISVVGAFYGADGDDVDTFGVSSSFVALECIGIDVEEDWCLGEWEVTVEEEHGIIRLDERLIIVGEISNIDDCSLSDEGFGDVDLVGHEDVLAAISAVDFEASDLTSEPGVIQIKELFLLIDF